MSFTNDLTKLALYANSINTVGSNGQVLTSNGSAVLWSSNISVASLTSNGTVGTAGQVLTSNGSTTYWGAGGTSNAKIFAISMFVGG